MSRLSKILGVPEGREFKFNTDKGVFKIEGNRCYIKNRYSNWDFATHNFNVLDMITHPELIKLIPEKPTLTDQRITAIKDGIEEGTPWATRDKGDDLVYFWEKKPTYNGEGFYIGSPYSVTSGSFYDFITYENSPVYLPDLIEE